MTDTPLGARMKTDEICELYADKKVGLTVKLLDQCDGEKEPSAVLIEGSAEALRLLAELLIAVAGEVENESFYISPFAAGSIHFSSSATLGVYIHRVPK